MSWLGFGFALLFLIGVLVAADATRRLLVIDVVAGKVLRLRGRGPADLVSDLEDVLRRTKNATGTVMLYLEGGRVTVRTTGSFDEGTKQMLRNVVGRFPTARLRTARRVKRG